MWSLMRRELTIATRAGGGTGLALAFFLIMVLLTALGVGRKTEILTATAPGTLWVGALLATLLSLDRMFQADHEDGSLDALVLSPMALEALIVAKIAAHWLTTGLPLVILSPVMAMMLQLPIGAYPWMLISLAIGTLSLSALGAIGAAITLGVRRGGLLLSLLVMPLFVPTLIFGTQCIQNAATGLTAETPLIFLTGLTLFSMVLAPPACAYALRINMR